MALEPMPASQAKTTLVICFKSTVATEAVVGVFFDSAFMSCIFCCASSRESPDFALDNLMMGDAMRKETTVAMAMLTMTAKVEPFGAMAR